MAKRGRKKRKGYFYEEQEEAVKNYINASTKEEKDKIFTTWLKPAFTKMIESIIRRYNLYLPDEEFNDTFNDTMSFLMTKIEKFNPDMNFKAYSYCGTICKNYLIYKINKFKKNQEKNERYDVMQRDLKNDINLSYNDHIYGDSLLSELIRKTCDEIDRIIKHRDKYNLSNDEIRVGRALIELMENWEDLFAQMGSNKFNKSSILLFLKETTFLNTKQIRDSMRKYKDAYYILKKSMINE
jgi:hypothetical protein